MKQESKFDPENIQDPAGRTKDPSNLTSMSQGWGLIQWTPGNKIIGLAKEAGVSGPLYELSTQLNLVWQHMNNHPDVTGHFDLNHFKSINDEVEAGAYFGSQIEGFQIAGNRLQDATDILHKYAGSGGGNGSSSSSSGDSSNCTSNSSSPDCATADGNAKILCEAKKYDPVNYSWGGGHNGGAAYHQACSTIEANDSSCALDCSGLVSVAVYDAFRANLVWTTNTLADDHANWKEVTLSQVQPGDVIEPNSSHIEIVDHVSGNTIHTFGAHTENAPQPQQVGAAQFPSSSSNKYFHYIGKGTQ